jgi:hypothetical protein
MTVDSAHFTEFFQQGHDVVRKTVDAWTRNAALVAEQLPTFSQQVDAEAAIDRYFDLGEKLLEAQRDFAKRLIGAATSVGVGPHGDTEAPPAPTSTEAPPAPKGTNGTPAPKSTEAPPAPKGTNGTPAPKGTNGTPAPKGTMGTPKA